MLGVCSQRSLQAGTKLTGNTDLTSGGSRISHEEAPTAKVEALTYYCGQLPPNQHENENCGPVGPRESLVPANANCKHIS